MIQQRIFVVLTLLITLYAPSAARATEPDTGKLALAEQVLIASGNDARVTAINHTLATQDRLVQALKTALPEAPAEWEPVMKTVAEKEIQTEAREFFEENRHIYATYFSEAELNDMLAFYRSPGGKALVAQTPAIIAEKQLFGQKLGREAIERMVQAMCAEKKCPAPVMAR